MNYTKPRIKNETSAQSTEAIYNFLANHSVGVLATTDKDDKPHATVVYFSVDPDFAMTFTTKRDTRKHQNMRHRKDVMLVAYDEKTQTTVQITGKVQDITGEPEAAEVFKQTLKAADATSQTGIPPVSKMFAGHYVAYRIMPTTIRSAVFLKPNSGGEELFDTIDFDD